MKWTKDQERVITERDRNILVSAAAGSGKTAVLTERIIRLLKEGADIRKFLVITFTNASASDMKEKIRKALSKEPSLAYQLRKLSTASISTFHSFCNQMIKDHFMLLGIDPHYRLLETTELHLLEQEILSSLLEEKFLEGDDAFLDLAESYGHDKSLYSLKSVVIQVKDYLSNRVSEEESVALILKNYEDKEYWERRTKDYTQDKLEVIRSLYKEAIQEVGEGVIPLLEDELLMTYSIETMTFDRFPLLKKVEKENLAFVEARNKAKDLRDYAKKNIQKIQEELLDMGDFDEHFEIFKSLAPRVKTLLELTLEFLKRYRERSIEEGVFSFSDLEYYALKVLEDEKVRESYRDKFDHIFIDEYQDTSPIQEAIISRIARDNNLFMVGDIKQSIYRFRRADPKIFLEKFNEYKPEKEGTPKGDSLRIDLNMNFRSAPPVIDGINAIFRKIMQEDFGGITYNDDHALVFGNESLKDIDQEVEFLLSTGDDPKQAEVDGIIKTIHALTKQGYRYRDIVILARSLKGYTRVMEKTFRDEGIPLHLSSSDIYLTSIEVELLVNYLRLIDNRRQDIPLLSLLRLPRYNLSDDELLRIRAHHREGFFVDALEAYDVPGEIYDKLQFFLEEMEEFRVKARSMGQDELLQEIYTETDFEGFILGLSAAKSRIANIRKLFLTAGDYESRSATSLSEFLLYLDELIKEEQDFEAAKTISEDSDSIRMMTIHKSKGLQFPVVILAGLHNRYYEPEAMSMIMTYEDFLLTDIIDLEKREKYAPFFRRILQKDSVDESRQEQIRVLYVALTRAEKKLILSSYVKEDYEVEAKALSKEALSSANSFFKLIELSGALEDHRFKLFIEEEPVLSEEKRKTKALGFKKEQPKLTSSKAKSKRSVSQLVKEQVIIPPLRRSDDAPEAGGMTRGTLFHKAMEWLDFGDVENSLSRLEAMGVLRDFQDRDLVLNYFESDTLKEVHKNALGIDREVPFVWKLETDEGIELIQGVIDQVIRLPEGVVLVDFKSDNSYHYLESYKKQIELYAKAYEEITGQRVLKKLLWFARLGETLEV